MQAMGLRTHAWNTAWRSILLLAGFPLLLAVMTFGVGLIFAAVLAHELAHIATVTPGSG